MHHEPKKKMKYINETPRYNLQSTNSNLPQSPCVCNPPFCDELPKGNQDSSSKGGACGVESLAPAKSARKA